MLRADLYEERIPLDSHLSAGDCRACGFRSREDFIKRLRGGHVNAAACSLSRERFLALLWAARPEEILPPVEVLQLPSPGPTGLVPVNTPADGAPVLVSGNSELTIEVLTAVLSTTTSPFWYLMVDTDGHTVDMALVYEVLTAERVHQAVREAELDGRAPASRIVLPGLAEPLRAPLASLTGRSVEAGPVCAAELPLYFGEESWRVSTEATTP